MTTIAQYNTTLRILEQYAANAEYHATEAQADARFAAKVYQIGAKRTIKADEAVIKANEKATDAAAAVTAYKEAVS